MCDSSLEGRRFVDLGHAARRLGLVAAPARSIDGGVDGPIRVPRVTRAGRDVARPTSFVSAGDRFHSGRYGRRGRGGASRRRAGIRRRFFRAGGRVEQGPQTSSSSEDASPAGPRRGGVPVCSSSRHARVSMCALASLSSDQLDPRSFYRDGVSRTADISSADASPPELKNGSSFSDATSGASAGSRGPLAEGRTAPSLGLVRVRLGEVAARGVGGSF